MTWTFWKAAVVAQAGWALATDGLCEPSFGLSRAADLKVVSQMIQSASNTRADSMDLAVLPGIDVLAAEGFAQLRGLRVGLITNHTGRDVAGRRTIDLLANAVGVRLTAIFTPEHGLSGDREGAVDSGQDEKTRLPVYSLYGASRRPAAEVLFGLDGLVVDLQDVGTRFYTYATTMAYAMEEAARRGIKVLVLDRPNPIGPAGVRGPVLETALHSFIGYFSMPVEHGMTLGELARMFNTENRIGADLTVITMRGYRRSLWYDQTGLPWIDPSPNLRSIEQIILYPAVGLIETTNVSVGRGTRNPFQFVGAPWIDGRALADYFRSRAVSGVRLEQSDFTPVGDRYAGEQCHGVRVVLVDRESLDAPRLGIELAAALHRLYPDRFELAGMLGHLGSRDSLAAIESGEDASAIVAAWQPALSAFNGLRNKYLIYP